MKLLLASFPNDKSMRPTTNTAHSPFEEPPSVASKKRAIVCSQKQIGFLASNSLRGNLMPLFTRGARQKLHSVRSLSREGGGVWFALSMSLTPCESKLPANCLCVVSLFETTQQGHPPKASQPQAFPNGGCPSNGHHKEKKTTTPGRLSTGQIHFLRGVLLFLFSSRPRQDFSESRVDQQSRGHWTSASANL